MGYNSVLDSTRYLVKHPTHVSINRDRIYEIAKVFSSEKLVIPRFDSKEYPLFLDNQTVDFIFLINTQDFQFIDFQTEKNIYLVVLRFLSLVLQE